MFRIGNTFIGDYIGMGAGKGIANFSWRRCVTRTLEEQDRYRSLRQMELIERIEIDAAPYTGNCLSDAGDEPW